MTQDELRDVLEYNPETGIFIWTVSIGKRTKRGDVAGCINGCGYVQITKDKKQYLGHRLAWFFTYGENPMNEIDHINGIRSDNRIVNLRDVPHRVNLQNIARNRMGMLPGAAQHCRTKRWLSAVTIKGKRIHLGSFGTMEEAHARYLEALNGID